MMNDNNSIPRMLTQLELKKLRQDMAEASRWMRNELRCRRTTGKRDGEAAKRQGAFSGVLSTDLECGEEP
ncbi:MAG: hypothetical protein ACM3X0_07170 [Bacteroidota bacterium]